MPCRYVLDTERRLVISTAWGHLTFAEMRAHQDQLRSDAAFVPEFNQLIDTTSVTRLDVSTEEFRTLACGSLFFSSSSRRAWIATYPLIRGMGPLLETYREVVGAEKDQLHVFYDHNAALMWLGL